MTTYGSLKPLASADGKSTPRSMRTWSSPSVFGSTGTTSGSRGTGSSPLQKRYKLRSRLAKTLPGFDLAHMTAVILDVVARMRFIVDRWVQWWMSMARRATEMRSAIIR